MYRGTTPNQRPKSMITDPRKVKVYNVAEKKLIGEFESMTKAAEFAGVDMRGVGNYIKKKLKCHKNKLGFTICFR